MRDLTDVIDQMLDAGINEFDEDFVVTVRSLQSSAEYAAPEIQSHWWLRVSYALEDVFGNKPDRSVAWIDNVMKIWMGE